MKKLLFIYIHDLSKMRPDKRVDVNPSAMDFVSVF